MSKYFTQEGLQKLKDELEQLVSVERPAISQQIAEARDKGDLSENAEYHAAKDAQGLLELKISKLQEEISQAERLVAVLAHQALCLLIVAEPYYRDGLPVELGKCLEILDIDVLVKHRLKQLGKASGRIRKLEDEHVVEARGNVERENDLPRLPVELVLPCT